jgi:hypothetical protein
MAAIGAQVAELKTHRFVVMEYPIDSNEYARTDYEEVTDCEELAMHARGIP